MSRAILRVFALMTFPLCYLALGFASAVHTRGPGFASAEAAAAWGDFGLLLLPSVLIYLVSLLFVRRRIRSLTTRELAAGSFFVALLAPLLIALSLLLLSAVRHSQAADVAFFFVVPFVPPVVACWTGLRVTEAWHRKRSAHWQVPAA